MRTWSIKTVVVTLSFTAILVVAAPRAEARSSQPSRSHVGATDRLQRAFASFMKRFGIRIVSDALPGDPIPEAISFTDTETETTTTVSPKKER